MGNYSLHEGVFLNADAPHSFPYSDGDEAENYILECVSRAFDLSTGSQELFNCIRDWPSMYHLSPKRANLLRPLQGSLKGKTVLEIGSGCGAITRYLGELDCRVAALEGSHRRAKITAERCGDLPNVRVFCDNFQDFALPEKFDVITLIGVLEYSNLYIQGDDPASTLLKKIRDHLNPGGCVLIAIENKLGLKYLAGAPEDHTGQSYFGIENWYSPSTVATYGKKDLQDLLAHAGFTHTSFWYPFPDYKLPKVVLSDPGINSENLLVGELLQGKFEYFQDHAYINHFSTSLAMDSFIENKLLADLSNSFLVVASLEELAGSYAPPVLAYTYNVTRKKPYCTENSFSTDVSGRIKVVKKNIYPIPDNARALSIKHRLENEEYHPGQLLSKKIIPLVSQSGWTVDDLSKWASSYYNILCKYATRQDNELFLEGHFLDLTPFNIIIDGETKEWIFDQEWISPEPLPLHYIFFRGVRYTLGDILFFNAPAEGTPNNLIDLTLAVIHTIIPFTGAMLQDCLEREKKYFSSIELGKIDPLDAGGLRIRVTDRERADKETALQEAKNALQVQLAQLWEQYEQLQIELMRRPPADETDPDLAAKELRALQERIDQLNAENLWYKRTYTDKSLLGIIKDRILSTVKRPRTG